MLTRYYLTTAAVLFCAGALGAQPLPPKPAPAPVQLVRLTGEFLFDGDTLIVREGGGELWLLRRTGVPENATPIANDRYLVGRDTLRFTGDGRTLCLQQTAYERIVRAPGTFRIIMERPLDELREEAARAVPPVEQGIFLSPDLVELAPLDTTIRYDIRYATPDNFMGAPFYTEARAFLQRGAALALLRAHRWLEQFGYGLLIHDAYRPWSVTKMFWDATPPAQRDFVANPARGSKHNRGCAVDLTLYDLRTGRPVEMPSTYDEFSDRAYNDYAGGTSLARWHRALLRTAMEREGFRNERFEWWHFDHGDWHRHAILNIPFESLR
jgi:D-alanyl-D-alanine dipeptidase